MPQLPNDKHERFAQCIVLGESQREAYRRVYKAKSDHAADQGGYRLMRRPDVVSRIESLRASLTPDTPSAFHLEADDILRELWSVASVPVEQLDPKASDKIAALEKMAKIKQIGGYGEIEQAGSRVQVVVVAGRMGCEAEPGELAEAVDVTPRRDRPDRSEPSAPGGNGRGAGNGRGNGTHAVVALPND